MIQTIRDWLTGFLTSPQPETPAAAPSQPSPELSVLIPAPVTHYRDLVLSLLREFEGCKLRPYQDGAGIWTIGYGFTLLDGKRVTANTPHLTQDEADDLLCQVMLPERERSVASLVTVPIVDYERAALVSLVYNIGHGNFSRSAVRSALNAGDRASAALAFRNHVTDHAGNVEPGLVRRRAAERAVFEGRTA